jgi:hypothetical protein
MWITTFLLTFGCPTAVIFILYNATHISLHMVYQQKYEMIVCSDILLYCSGLFRSLTDDTRKGSTRSSTLTFLQLICIEIERDQEAT